MNSLIYYIKAQPMLRIRKYYGGKINSKTDKSPTFPYLGMDYTVYFNSIITYLSVIQLGILHVTYCK